MDVRAAQGLTLQVGETKLVPTGFAMEIPPGFEVQLRPRSGLALKHGLTMLNSPATIDSDYRGEVGVILTNLGREPFEVPARRPRRADGGGARRARRGCRGRRVGRIGTRRGRVRAYGRLIK